MIISGIAEERSLETGLFITWIKQTTYGGVWRLIIGHKGASLLHVVQTVKGPYKQFSLPNSFGRVTSPRGDSRRECPTHF